MRKIERTALKEQVGSYVQKNKDLLEALEISEGTSLEVLDLAQGEYNLNFRLAYEGKQVVFRLNTGSQLHLDNQILYEYRALELLAPSGVTPRPLYVDDSRKEFPFGLLVMEYLSGEPLDYRTDLWGAASTFARIHSLPTTGEKTPNLIREPGPLLGIYREAQSLLEKYFACTYASGEVKEILGRVLAWAGEAHRQDQYFLQDPWVSIINTEVNSHNFIVNKERRIIYLVDWEKPLLGEPAQDLSHFLVPTTTLWKRNYRLTREEEEAFLQAYLREYPPHPAKDTLRERVEIIKPFIHLRAVAWCAMAWVEYTSPGRILRNEDTFLKIQAYLEPDFLADLFPFLKFERL